MITQGILLAAAGMCLLAASCFADKMEGTDKHPVVLLKTNKGDVKIQLDAEKAPITVANFLHYVNEGFYNGTIFHRVIPNFMVQGGGFTADMNQKATTKPAIKNEAENGLKNKRGAIAMARTSDINSATAQFFINVVDNTFLDHKDRASYGYAVFGEVIDGMPVVDAIVSVPTKRHGGYDDVPVDPLVIQNATVIKQ